MTINNQSDSSDSTTYEMIWRNKWLTSDATSVDEMIKCHFQAIEKLQEIKKDGLVVDFDGADDDYIFICTQDADKAHKYGMYEIDVWDEEELDDNLDEDLAETLKAEFDSSSK